MILVTAATGMFGSRTVRQLAARGAPVRALVHSAEHARGLPGELAVGDMDRPDTLADPLDGVETVFLISPMDEHIEERETNVLRAALDAGVERIVKLYGAVRHRGDPLDRLHVASLDAIKASGLEWALVSPSSVMETSLLPHAETIREMNAMFGCAGDGRVGLIAADDVARAAAVVLTERAEPGRNYELTGPETLTMTEIAAVLGHVLAREITYYDMSEDEFRKLLVEQAGMSPEDADIKVILHLSAWRRGDADLHTDTVRELTGQDPMAVAEWVAAHREAFEAPRVPAPARD
ncbi:MAG TPA: NmrA family NAD(P)-binding protein [Thermoleophilaceae bacterium]|nr:NmrA family NAD(P)-binding protein [Thermoleophilaceae bacterium]